MHLESLEQMQSLGGVCLSVLVLCSALLVKGSEERVGGGEERGGNERGGRGGRRRWGRGDSLAKALSSLCVVIKHFGSYSKASPPLLDLWHWLSVFC